MFTHRYIPAHAIRKGDDHLLRANDAHEKGFLTSEECDQCHFGTLHVKRERRKGMKRAQFFIRNRMLMPEEIEGIQQGTMEIRKSHILDYDNNRMALLYKNRADEIHGRRLLEIEEDNWKELTYDIEEPKPKRHFPRV